MEIMSYSDKITQNSEIMLGKPVIKGTRITVEQIITKMSQGYTVDEILEIYPHLNKLQILAALEYAAKVIAHEDILEV